MHAAKDLLFNRNMEALKKMQAGADKLATVVGVTLGPKVCGCQSGGIVVLGLLACPVTSLET